MLLKVKEARALTLAIKPLISSVRMRRTIPGLFESYNSQSQTDDVNVMKCRNLSIVLCRMCHLVQRSDSRRRIDGRGLNGYKPAEKI